MAIKKEIKIEEVVEFLNSLIELDPDAVKALFAVRVNCNEKIADHPSVQVAVFNEGFFSMGVTGILNGLFGVDKHGWGHITAVYDDGKLINFQLLTDEDVANYIKGDV